MIDEDYELDGRSMTAGSPTLVDIHVPEDPLAADTATMRKNILHFSVIVALFKAIKTMSMYDPEKTLAEVVTDQGILKSKLDPNYEWGMGMLEYLWGRQGWEEGSSARGQFHGVQGDEAPGLMRTVSEIIFPRVVQSILKGTPWRKKQDLSGFGDTLDDVQLQMTELRAVLDKLTATDRLDLIQTGGQLHHFYIDDSGARASHLPLPFESRDAIDEVAFGQLLPLAQWLLRSCFETPEAMWQQLVSARAARPPTSTVIPEASRSRAAAAAASESLPAAQPGAVLRRASTTPLPPPPPHTGNTMRDRIRGSHDVALWLEKMTERTEGNRAMQLVLNKTIAATLIETIPLVQLAANSLRSLVAAAGMDPVPDPPRPLWMQETLDSIDAISRLYGMEEFDRINAASTPAAAAAGSDEDSSDSD